MNSPRMPPPGGGLVVPEAPMTGLPPSMQAPAAPAPGTGLPPSMTADADPGFVAGYAPMPGPGRPNEAQQELVAGFPVPSPKAGRRKKEPEGATFEELDAMVEKARQRQPDPPAGIVSTAAPGFTDASSGIPGGPSITVEVIIPGGPTAVPEAKTAPLTGLAVPYSAPSVRPSTGGRFHAADLPCTDSLMPAPTTSATFPSNQPRAAAGPGAFSKDFPQPGASLMALTAPMYVPSAQPIYVVPLTPPIYVAVGGGHSGSQSFKAAVEEEEWEYEQEAPLPFPGYIPTPGFTQGSWEYVVVDPHGLRLRGTIDHAKKHKTGGELANGEEIKVCERGQEAGIMWLCLADGRGFAFERTNRRRCSQIQYEDIPDRYRQQKMMVFPRAGAPVPMRPIPCVKSGPTEASALPGSLVMANSKATLICQDPKSCSKDQSRSFLKVRPESGPEGWIPEFSTAGSFMLQTFKMEAVSGWLAVINKNGVSMWCAPGFAGPNFMYSREKIGSGDIFPMEEQCTVDGLTFCRLPDGGWVCTVDERNTSSLLMVQREEHWWQYSCIDKEGTAIRTAPTRMIKMNTGNRLKNRQRFVASEMVRYPDGDAFLHLEPPLDGWVPMTKLGGGKKMTPLNRMERSPNFKGPCKGKGKGRQSMTPMPGVHPYGLMMQPQSTPALYVTPPGGRQSGDFGIDGGGGFGYVAAGGAPRINAEDFGYSGRQTQGHHPSAGGLGGAPPQNFQQVEASGDFGI